MYASLLLEGAGAEDVVAVVSAPSVFVAMQGLLKDYEPGRPKPRTVLLEHDRRFEVFPDFIFYDFQHPFKLPADLKGRVDRIICDPPFLSDDCQTKSELPSMRHFPCTADLAAALTARWLAKPDCAAVRTIVCTGERMGETIQKVYKAFGVRTTTYEPVHARGLSNEFYCYANFECEHWQWRAA